MNLDCFSTMLVEAGLGTVGETIFVDMMPDGVEQAVLLKTTIGGQRYDRYIPGYFRTARMQAIVRSPVIDDGNALAMAVMKGLTYRDLPPRVFTDTASGAMLMMLNHCYPDSLPSKYPRSPGGTFEWSINFDVNLISPL